MASEKRQDAKYYHEVKAKDAARKTSWIILKDDQKRSGMCKRKSERELGVGRGHSSEALQRNNRAATFPVLTGFPVFFRRLSSKKIPLSNTISRLFSRTPHLSYTCKRIFNVPKGHLDDIKGPSAIIKGPSAIIKGPSDIVKGALWYH